MILGLGTNNTVMDILESNELPLFTNILTRDLTLSFEDKGIVSLGNGNILAELPNEVELTKGSAIYLTVVNGNLYYIYQYEEFLQLLPIAEDALEECLIYLCRDQEHMGVVNQLVSIHEKVKAEFTKGIADNFLRDFPGFILEETQAGDRADYFMTMNYFDQYMVGQEPIRAGISIFFSRNYSTLPSIEFKVAIEKPLAVNAFSLHSMAEDIYHVCAHLEACHQYIMAKIGKDIANNIVEADIESTDEELTPLTNLETDETWGQIPPEGE